MKMKNKRIVTLLCALLMVFSMTLPGNVAFAADSSRWTSVGPDPSFNQVTSLLESNNQLYKGTSGNGVLAWDGDAWTQAGTSWPSGNGVAFLADVSGTVYAGPEQGGIVALDAGVWTPVGADTWPKEYGSAILSFCLTDFNGTVYAGSYGGVWALEDGSWTQVGAESWPLNYGYPDTAEGLVSAGGTLYVQTAFSGIYTLGSDDEWTPTETVGGNWVNCLMANTVGTVYAGTGQSGVWTLDNGDWVQVGTSTPEEGVSSLADVDGTLYAGFDSGVYTLDGGEWSAVNGFPLPSESDYYLTSAGETLYCGGGNYVYALNGGDWQEVGDYDGLPVDNSGKRGLPLADVNGTLYAATVGGVWELEDGKWAQVGASSWPAFDGFADRACSLLVDDLGTVYAGTAQNGVYVVGSDSEWTQVGTSWPSGQGAWCLASFEGVLYAGTYDWNTSYNNGAGVLMLDSGEWTSVGDNTDGRWVTSMVSAGGVLYASTWGGGVWELEDTEWASLDSGPSSLVYTLEDMDGTLYVGGYDSGSDYGVLWSWDGSSWTEEASNQSNGLQMIYSLKEIDGTFYAGTDNGAYLVDGSGDLTRVGGYRRASLSFANVDGILYTGTENNGVLAYSADNPSMAKTPAPVQTVTVRGNTSFQADDIAEGSDNDVLIIIDIESDPAPGTATAELSDGTVTITGDALGSTSVTVTVSDPYGGTINITVPITVANVSDNGGSGGGGRTPVPAPINEERFEIPASFLTDQGPTGTMTLKSNIGSITIPSNMLTGIAGIEGKKAEITIGKGDTGNLPGDVKAMIGTRPVISLSLSIDGRQKDWNNPDAPVTVSIPYTPTAAELSNPESIVIWYIDGSGNAVCVPNGHYDPATKTVTFSTSHFSLFAVGYNKINFLDVAGSAWYADAVNFTAAREITSGTGNGKFSPDAKLTRGQLMVMLMRAYGIGPDTAPADNFSDAGSTYYTGYLAAAKRLGITEGVGNNLYAPEKQITRQEMFTLLYNTLKAIDQLPEPDSGKPAPGYRDADSVASWAMDAVDRLSSAGMISGNNGKLSPENTTTRAEMAQVLFNLMTK